MNSFFLELKKRCVYRVAFLYAVVGWLAIQIAATVLPAYHAPEWILPSFITLLALGFPIALVLAWAFEFTPAGMKSESTQRFGRAGSRRGAWIVAAFGLSAGAIVVAGSWFWHSRNAQPAPSSIEAKPATASREVVEKSIAVLPFQNLSADKENSYFTDGVQDEILTVLSKVADLKVISRTSVMQYRDAAARNVPEIGRALNVAHVLEGSVQRAGNRVRVTAQLINARTDAHLWAEHYDRDLADVFAIQSEIAQKIADQLQAALSPKEHAAMTAKPTADMFAYDLYLQAKEIGQRSGDATAGLIDEEVRLLDDAVARDSGFTAALCLLARAHLKSYWYNQDHTAARLELAQTALEKAARLHAEAGEVHLTRAIFHYWGSRAYEPALRELAFAREALPNNAEIPYFAGLIERREGRFDESTAHLQEAIAIDPRNRSIIFSLASGNYLALRRYEEAARICESVLAWAPEDFQFELARAKIDRERAADLGQTRKALESGAAKKADPNELARARMELALDERDYRSAEIALAACRLAEITTSGYVIPREYFAALIARGLGEPEKARTFLQTAHSRAAASSFARPDDAKALILLGGIEAELGAKSDAVRDGERALKLFPPAKDGVDGPTILRRLASIYARTGNSSRALDLLEEAARMPFGPDYGSLKLDEEWDSLRREPRFEQLLASLAPRPTDANH